MREDIIFNFKLKIMEVTLKIKKDYVKAILHKGKTKAHTPKSYKEVGYAGHDIGFWASQEHLTMYRNSRGELMYKVYIKGSIFPFYGKLEILN